MKLKAKEIKAIEKLGWDVSYDKKSGYYTLSNYSPAGEDLQFEVNDKEDLIHYCNGFDVDEHFELWYGANRGEPSSPRDLFEDCEAIEKMLNEIVEALEEVK